MATDPEAEARAEPMIRKTVAGLAEDQLRAMILGGLLVPGERLNEVVIADRLGISRGPLREAIQRLASEGLLSVVPHKGASVRTLTEAELRDLYELRIAIETYAVRLGAARATPAEFEMLTALLEKTGKVLSSSEQVPYPSNLDLHVQLVGLAHNAVLARAMREADAKIHLARARSAYDPNRARAAYEEHAEIVTHLLNGQADASARLLERHLELSLANAIRRMGKQG